MKTIRRFILSLLILMSAFVAFAQDGNLRRENLLMTFVPNVQFAPMYVSIADDYFADAGFDVNLEYLNEPDVLDLVAANQARFGVVSGEQVILASAAGREVTYVYAWFQQYPIGIIVPENSTIQTPANLAGYRIGLPGRFGANYSGLTALLQSAGLNESNINIEEIGFAAPEIFCLGILQASVIYINNEPIQINNRISQGDCGNITGVRVIPVSDYIELVSNGIIVNRQFLQNNPDAVRAFINAFHQGLQTTINNPAHAYLQSVDFVEGLPLTTELRDALQRFAVAQDVFLRTNPTREAIAQSRLSLFATLSAQFPSDDLVQLEVLLASIDLWDAPVLGFSNIENWENMQTTLLTLGELGTTVDLTTLFTNAMLESE